MLLSSDLRLFKLNSDGLYEDEGEERMSFGRIDKACVLHRIMHL